MPKRKKQEEGSNFEGFPEHGDEYQDEQDRQEEEQEEQEEQQEEEDPVQKQLREMRERMETLEAENRSLRSAPPKEPDPEPDPEPDWETLMLEDPAKALALHGEMVEKRVTAKLKQEYTNDKRHSDFWGEFYKENEDLKEDKDLVEAVLHNHMASLANLPVETAAKKLADLTRERIIRYSGGKPGKGGKKAHVEGGGSGKPSPKNEPETQKVVTLSDVIRSRRAARRGKGAAA